MCDFLLTVLGVFETFLQILTGDGFVEVTVASLTSSMMFGLAHDNPNQDYVKIPYTLYSYPAGPNTLIVYEKSVYKGSFGSYTTGDVLRVAVQGGVVRYYRK